MELVEKIDIEKNIFKILNNKIKNKIICFLGVTFKANTDDLRDSSAINLISKFAKKGSCEKSNTNYEDI